MFPACSSRFKARRLPTSVALAALTLAACHGKAPASAQVSIQPTPSISSQLRPLRADAPAPPTSRQLVETLKSSVDILPLAGLPYGFDAAQKTVSCDPASGEIAYTCAFAFKDSKHGDGAADLKFVIFDAPARLDAIDAQLKAKIESEPGRIKASETVSIDTSGVDPSRKAKLPGQCRQSRGDQNGYAVCVFMVDPRVGIVSVVAPERASVSAGDVADADVERAQSLAFVGYMALKTANFSTREANPTPAVTVPVSADVSTSGAIAWNAPSRTPAEAEARAALKRRIQDITGYEPAKPPQ